MSPPLLMAVPNVSEGRDARAIEAIAAAFVTAPAEAHGAGSESGAARLLDVHSDADHHRSVFTLAAPQGVLAHALLRGAREAVGRIDVVSRRARADTPKPDRQEPQGKQASPIGAPGRHPHVGALDVAPLVYLDPARRGAACAEALLLGDMLAAELELPVFLYGELSAESEASSRSRAALRAGGLHGLAERIARGELTPDFGPARLHPTAGATLLSARPPLVAFNLELAPPAVVGTAREIAAVIREGGSEGLPGVRALGIELAGGVAQVSTNVERPFEVPLAEVVRAVARHADVVGAELVGLAPAAALEGFPADLALAGFDPARHVIENALRC